MKEMSQSEAALLTAAQVTCDKETQCVHLFTAGDGAAAEVSTGFGVDHGGNVLLRHEVSEELLTALRLLPDKQHVWLFQMET